MCVRTRRFAARACVYGPRAFLAQFKIVRAGANFKVCDA